MTTIVVRPSDIKAIIDASFPDYKGQKATVRIQQTVNYNASDLTWQDGSKTEVVALRCFTQTEGDNAHEASLARRNEKQHYPFYTIELTTIYPWSGQSLGGPIPADVMLVEHVIFCGKDLGIRCVASPDSQFLPRLSLPVVVELSRDEVVVLSAHSQLKGGHYRERAYAEAACIPYDAPWAGAVGPCFKMQSAWQVHTNLASRGFLKVNEAGASSITVEGRNALESLPADRKVRL